MDDDEEETFVRVDGNVICSSCEKPYNNHPRVKRYAILTGEEMWLVVSCTGSLLKT